MNSTKDTAVSITGNIYRIGKPMTFASGFRKVDLIVVQDADAKYPNYIPFTFTKDNCDLVTGYTEGDEVTIEGFIGGRMWAREGEEERCFLAITAVKIIPRGKIALDTATQPKELADADAGAADADDCPF